MMIDIVVLILTPHTLYAQHNTGDDDLARLLHYEKRKAPGRCIVRSIRLSVYV